MQLAWRQWQRRERGLAGHGLAGRAASGLGSCAVVHQHSNSGLLAKLRLQSPTVRQCGCWLRALAEHPVLHIRTLACGVASSTHYR
eukprot:2379694-Alexandrium_andersonii.AAC.1